MVWRHESATHHPAAKLYRENSGGIAPRRLAEYLITDLAPHEITSRNSRAIDIPGIPMRSLVEIILIGVEDILYSGVHLQGCGLEDREVVRQLQVQVEEITSLLLTILGNVTRQVLHQHAARIGSRQ